MDGWFTTALIFMFFAIVATVLWRIKAKRLAATDFDVLMFKRIAIGLWIFGGVLVLWSSVHQVDTKNVGAVTSFGKPVGNLDNGLHMTLPWEVVTELDAAVQTDSYAGPENRPSDSGSCVIVRIAHQATACINFTVKWQLRQDKADEVFQSYREFDNIKSSLVTNELPATGNEVFESYDPMAVNDKGEFTAASNVELSEDATKVLTRRSGSKIQVISVVVNNVGLSSDTQRRLNELNDESAKTRVALQAQRTADAQALANSKLAASVSNDPNVLVDKCLSIMREAIEKNYPLPAGGVNCWPGSQTAVVVPSGGNRPN